MERVRVVIETGGPAVPSGDAGRALCGLTLRLEHPRTGEVLDCRDVKLSFPMDGVVTATAEFVVSEILTRPPPEPPRARTPLVPCGPSAS